MTKLGLMCLAPGHNAVMLVRFEPATPRSQVKHSTTEPLRSRNKTVEPRHEKRGLIACAKCADSDQPAQTVTCSLIRVFTFSLHNLLSWTVSVSRSCNGFITCKSNEIPASFGPITEYMITLVAMESLGLFSSTSTFNTICM